MNKRDGIVKETFTQKGYPVMKVLYTLTKFF